MYFATNIANFLACPHIATLEQLCDEGVIKKELFADPGLELLKELGLRHEQEYLNELKAKGLRVVEIPTETEAATESSNEAVSDLATKRAPGNVIRVPWEDAAKATRAAMAGGADVIYQATFVEQEVLAPGGASGRRDACAPSWAGRADFLIRVETPSALGAWSYEVVETKLAKSTKARALIQLCLYSELVATIQGKLPERMHVVLGKRAEPASGKVSENASLHCEAFSLHRYHAYFRKVKREFLKAIKARPETYPEPVEHCAICDWFTVCNERWHADDHLSLVANITRNQRSALGGANVNTVAELAKLPVRDQVEVNREGRPGTAAPTVITKIDRIAPAPLWRIREQARVQVRGREEGRPIYELIDAGEYGREEKEEEPKGLAALPAPSAGDLFLDFEGDPFAFEQGIEYLIGTVRLSAASAHPANEELIHEETRNETSLDTNKSGDRSPHSKELDDRVDVSVTDGDKAIHERARNETDAVYEAIWAFSPVEEKRAFEKFIASVMDRRRQFPDMHIYHYASYETTAIKHLAGRHNVCSEEVDELLRAGVFVDLFRVLRQSLRASVESYSIKKMEPFYGFKRTVELRDATSSLQAFEAVLALGDDPAQAQRITKTIEEYNRDDCLSTWKLQEWLESLRSEYESTLGQPLPRPELKSGAPNEELKDQLTEIAVLKERLTDGLSEDENDWSEEQHACWLLAQLLEWHRREDKSMWWEYYRLCELSDEELIEDKNALGGLVYVGIIGEEKKSVIHRYRFPFQDYGIDRALEVHDPRTQNSAGTLVGIDEANLTLDLKRKKNSDKPHPSALVPYDYINPKRLVQSLVRFAGWVAENEGFTESGGALVDAVESTELRPLAPFPTCNSESSPGFPHATHSGEVASKFQVARDILLRRAPRVSGVELAAPTQESCLLDAAKRLGLALDSSILPIQGPPGSGKTHTGAHMILALVEAGKRVGVTANSHKVICNLLAAICKAAAETHRNVSIVQKVTDDDDGFEHDCVKITKANEVPLEKLNNSEAQIVAGTAWLWAREQYAESVEVLFVDEAGQMSLANVLAVSQAAKSVVLLGDPQQLDQPQKGVHPPGAEVSALEHLLNGCATIEAHQGLFLAESWRLHPDICAFTSEVFYDRRLTTRPENARQRLNAAGLLDGTGLRFVPVSHNGNQSDSPEEVEVIAELVEGLLSRGVTWTNKDYETEPLELKDILIVAPYNAQVALLARRLPEGARVGTVDKFQGQQAPVVFYSMTTSTPEDAPRGMEFLYSSNRLNVATSRAQCMTVLVASPLLFDVQCRTPRQMELANAFCRYSEMAEVLG